MGARVVLPPLEQVVRRDVRLVADRHERREPETPHVGRLEQSKTERSALRDEPNRSLGKPRGREGGVEPRVRDGETETVRTDETRAVRADESEQSLLPLGALAADLGEAGRDDADGARSRAQNIRDRI